MENVSWLFNAVEEWLSPFRYPRATFDEYPRVKLWWFVRFALGGIMSAALGFVIAVSGLAWVMVGMDYGTNYIGEANIIGWYAARLCQTQGLCSPAHLTGIIISVAIAACGIGWTIWIMLVGGDTTIKPGKVTDDELDELRQLGYIVLQEEEFRNAIMDAHNHCVGCPFIDSQPHQLDPIGVADRGPQPETEGIG